MSISQTNWLLSRGVQNKIKVFPLQALVSWGLLTYPRGRQRFRTEKGLFGVVGQLGMALWKLAWRPTSMFARATRLSHFGIRFRSTTSADVFAPLDTFVRRHVGPNDQDIQGMLGSMGLKTLDELVSKTVPKSILLSQAPKLKEPRTEADLLSHLKSIAARNIVNRSFIGMGYSDCHTPAVILRNVIENPGWYTQYTPYQPEIAQGRLESLLNFQTMVCDLTGLPVSNASLLDEGTAAAEAMTMAYSSVNSSEKNLFFVDQACHPQTIAVVKTRAGPLGIQVLVGDYAHFDFERNGSKLCGVLVQYPATDGRVLSYDQFFARVHEHGGLAACATDLLALTILRPPGEFGADIALGNSQRFGVPLGFGGPHAAFFACKDQQKRRIPGRIVGVSKDAQGRPALRLALQTREQHIRREKASSNICTAQALLANVAAMYAVYHGPDGLKAIASRVHQLTAILADGLRGLGHVIP